MRDKQVVTKHETNDETLSASDSTANASTALQQEIDLDDVRIDPAWALLVPASLALRRLVLPLCKLDEHVQVACLDAEDHAALEAVERYVKQPIAPVVVEEGSLRRALARILGVGGGAAGNLSVRSRAVDARAATDADAEGSVAICDELLQAAFLRGASDIHIDPAERHVRVRFRVDGLLEEYRELPLDFQNGLLSRFKVLAEMDIAEKRAPQDGRFTAAIGGVARKVDVRVATLPTRHGERMTLRLLSLQTQALTLERLGMSPRDLAAFEVAIDKPHGLVLLTGPTGSGKTTTLYAAIRQLLGREGGNVITIEDPVEYEINGVAQVEVDYVDKVSFHKALRSVLRHDPDVIMIGEIRDAETADVAVKSALTGHLVFSTLHTNTAAGVVTRLVDMGLQRYLVAATLRLAVAQRLVRQLCERCRRPRQLLEREALALHAPNAAGATVYESGRCLYCAGRGFTGRLGLFELVPVDESLSQCIARDFSEAEIVQYMREQGQPLLLEDGVEKALAGRTTVQEVLGAVTVW